MRMEKHEHFSSWKFLKNIKKMIYKILFLVSLWLWVFKNAEIQDQYHSTRWLVDPPFRALILIERKIQKSIPASVMLAKYFQRIE